MDKYSKKVILYMCYFFHSLTGYTSTVLPGIWILFSFGNVSCSLGGSLQDPVDCTKNVVDFFGWFLCQFPCNTFVRVMGPSNRGRFLLSAWNKVDKYQKLNIGDETMK